MEDTLSTEGMLQIAKEIGFAESAFVRQKDVRIFTVDEEVPQAGHPIIGLAEVIGAEKKKASPGEEELSFTMQTKKGPITVRSGAEAGQWFASQDPPEWLGDATAESVAAIMRGAVGVSDLAGTAFPIGTTTGLNYALVSVSSEAALDTLDVDPTAPHEQLYAQCSAGVAWVYFYVRTSESAVRTRMFCFEDGKWVEDVATGSAAGPLAAHLAPFEGVFTQGSTRRAHIHVKSTARTGERVQIGGTVLRVAEGTWRALPSQ
jgi:trans-2,3-dihydro-3-hydroxyanthranilate isomerase